MHGPQQDTQIYTLESLWCSCPHNLSCLWVTTAYIMGNYASLCGREMAKGGCPLHSCRSWTRDLTQASFYH